MLRLRFVEPVSLERRDEKWERKERALNDQSKRKKSKKENLRLRDEVGLTTRNSELPELAVRFNQNQSLSYLLNIKIWNNGFLREYRGKYYQQLSYSSLLR
jgi:hypothetical protein